MLKDKTKIQNWTILEFPRDSPSTNKSPNTDINPEGTKAGQKRILIVYSVGLGGQCLIRKQTDHLCLVVIGLLLPLYILQARAHFTYVFSSQLRFDVFPFRCSHNLTLFCLQYAAQIMTGRWRN